MRTTVKTCFRCRLSKPVTEFYRHPMMADGHLGKCKDCTKRDVRSNRRKRQDYYAAYDRERGSRTIAKGQKNAAATSAVARAVREGRLIKEPCFFCAATESLHAHHIDYTKKLDVVWLCARCHRRLHAYEELREKVTNG